MQTQIQRNMPPIRRAAVAALALFAGLPWTGATARAEGIELVPSVGIQRAVKGGDEAKPYYGLALRTRLMPALKAEVGASYRKDEYDGGSFAVKSWPITASLWLAPSPLYVGGGIGWYNTTVEFAPALGLEDQTDREFGMHVGGGLTMPLAPSVGLDLHGRYIFLPVRDDPVTTLKEWNPSYWTTSLGLALRF